MKKNLTTMIILLSVLMTCVPMHIAQAAKSIDALNNNILKNGMFENGVDGWTAPEGTQLEKEMNITYDQSSGSAHIVQPKKKSYVSTQFEIRNNQHYHVEAQIRLKESLPDTEAIFNIRVTNSANETSVISMPEVAVSSEWAKISGDIVYSKAGAGVSMANREDVYSSAECYLEFKTAAELVDFYLDNVIITSYDGSVNPDFSFSTPSYGWNWNSSFELVDIDREEVGELIASGEFPDVDKALKLPKNFSTRYRSPVQCVPIDQGQEYVLTAWYKILDDKEDGFLTFMLETARKEYSHFMINVGKTPVKNDGKWHKIEANYIHNGKSFGGDVNMYVSLFNKGDGLYNAVHGADREFMVTGIQIKPKKNAVKRSGFLYANSVEYCASDQLNNGDTKLSNWTTDGIDAKILYNEDAYQVEPYNGSAAIGVFGVNGGNTLMGQNLMLANKKYDISIWVKPDENVVGTPSANLYVKKLSGGRAANFANTELIPGQWTRVHYEGKDITETSNVSIRITGLTEGNVYFGGFSVLPSNELPEKPTVNEVRLSDFIVGKVSNKPDISVESTNGCSLRYQYVMADDENFADSEVIESGHTETREAVPGLYVQSDYADRYVKLRVLPVDTYLQYGEWAESEPKRVKNKVSAQIIKFGSLEDAWSPEVQITNTSDEKLAVAVIATCYDSDGCMQAIGISNVILEKDDEKNVSVTVNIPSGFSGGYGRIYICGGSEDPNNITPELSPILELVSSK